MLAVVIMKALQPVQRTTPRNVLRLLRKQELAHKLIFPCPILLERECCLLVLNLVSSTLPCIRQPGPSIFCSHVRTWPPVCLQSLVSCARCRYIHPCSVMLKSRQCPPISWMSRPRAGILSVCSCVSTPLNMLFDFFQNPVCTEDNVSLLSRSVTLRPL